LDNRQERTALAVADLDEDGTLDLIYGYSTNQGGFLCLRRGNVDSAFPSAPEARPRKATGESEASAALQLCMTIVITIPIAVRIHSEPGPINAVKRSRTEPVW
jgi:hypothetical protein